MVLMSSMISPSPFRLLWLSFGWAFPVAFVVIVAYLLKTLCNSHLLKSHVRLRKIGPITIGSRVRATISCVFLPQAVGASLVHLRHETKNRVTA